MSEMKKQNDEAFRKAIEKYHKWRNSRLQRFLTWWRYRNLICSVCGEKKGRREMESLIKDGRKVFVHTGKCENKEAET